MNPIRDQLEALYVKRYHTHETIRSQDLAQHVGRMMVLACHLTLPPDQLVDVFKYIAKHDLVELVTGDIPSTAKSPSFKKAILAEEAVAPAHLQAEKPAEHLYNIVKALDNLELVLWCMDELLMGNRRMLSVLLAGVSNYEKFHAALMPYASSDLRALAEKARRIPATLKGEVSK